jgi:hypothetical protein
LIGKKHIVPDLSKTDDPQVKEDLTSLRGDTKIEDYKFSETTPKPVAEKYAKLMFESGLPKSIANKLIAEHELLVKGQMEEQFSDTGMKEGLNRVFGDDKKKAAEVINIVSEMLRAEGKAHMEKSLPNSQVEFMFGFVNKVIEKYGAKETGAGGGGGEGGSPKNIETTRSEIRAEMRKLDSAPHTAQQKKALQDKLDATYKT